MSKRWFPAFLAFTFVFAACSNPAGPMDSGATTNPGGNEVIWPSYDYSVTINIVTYTLSLSSPDGRVGDNYVLTVKRKSGYSVATEKISTGKITQSYITRTFQPSFVNEETGKAAPTFTAMITTTEIIGLDGLITFDDGTAEEGLGSFFIIYADKNNITGYTAHIWSKWSSKYAATCMATGWDYRICLSILSNSGDPPFPDIPIHPSHYETRSTNIVPNAHKWGKWKITTEPTETVDGVETRICVYNPSHRETRVYTIVGLENE